MKSIQTPRRDFLFQMSGTAAAAWVSTQWPAIAAAAQHAHEAAKSNAPYKFEVLRPDQAKDVEAITSQIIPTDELPGAREAGVVYFIDRALKTFAADAVPTYQKGLADLTQLTSETYPGVKSFAGASPEQQGKLMKELVEKAISPTDRPRGLRAQLVSTDFLQAIWQHTVFGFLADPETGGNRDYDGWKVIGREPGHSFSPPFGFYDKDYPGWQPVSPETEKK
jgi:gluconate 2-dehydrogenase gamma chain